MEWVLILSGQHVFKKNIDDCYVHVVMVSAIGSLFPTSMVIMMVMVVGDGEWYLENCGCFDPILKSVEILELFVMSQTVIYS